MVSIYPDKLFPRREAALLTSYEITVQDYNVDGALSRKTSVPRAVQQSCLLTVGKDGNNHDTPNFKLWFPSKIVTIRNFNPIIVAGRRTSGLPH